MAVVLNPFARAIDDDGEPMPFALLYTRDPSAPASGKTAWTDAANTVPHTNPLVADEGGWFQEMFAPEGTTFNLLLTPAGGDPDQPYQAVTDSPAVGNDSTSTFSRILPDARFSISSGNTDGASTEGVIYSVGKLDPISTGGYGLFNGWAATQATQFKFDAALSKFTGTIDAPVIKRDGVTEPFERLISSGVETAATTIDIALPDDFNAFRLCVQYLKLSASDSTLFRFSFDGGSTYLSSAAAYRSAYREWVSSSPTALAGSAQDVTYIQPGSTQTGTADYASRIEAMIVTDASKKTSISGELWDLTSGASIFSTFGGNTKGANGRATHIRIYTNSGATIACRWALLGVPGL